MSTTPRYVSRTVSDGWRIYDRKAKHWWGNVFKAFPGAVLDELNGQKRQEILIELCKISYTPKEK